MFVWTPARSPSSGVSGGAFVFVFAALFIMAAGTGVGDGAVCKDARRCSASATRC